MGEYWLSDGVSNASAAARRAITEPSKSGKPWPMLMAPSLAPSSLSIVQSSPAEAARAGVACNARLAPLPVARCRARGVACNARIAPLPVSCCRARVVVGNARIARITPLLQALMACAVRITVDRNEYNLRQQRCAHRLHIATW